MTFTPDQTAELGKPLKREHVATRKGGGGQLSYIEGWHAIAEANRIFGFDGWTSETAHMECVSMEGSSWSLLWQRASCSARKSGNV